jgi:hypothetical protein
MANFLVQFINLWRQPTRNNNLTYEKYLPYFDGNDNFPLIWHDAISKSPSATSCLSTVQDFLEGEGFDPAELENIKVNSRGETLFQLHQKTAKDFGEYEGFAWLIRYNALGQVTEWENLPFENVRLGKPDSKGYISKIHYNPYFGTVDFKKWQNETVIYDTFSPSQVTAQIAIQKEKYKGQIFYYGTTNALSRFYPMPEAHSAIKWFGIEAGVADYHETNINNGFLQPYILLMRGNPNEPINNPEASSNEKPLTRAEYFEEIMGEKFMGAKRVGNLMVQWVENPDEKPEVLPLPTNNSGDQFLALDTAAIKKITIAWKVPAILANINEGVSLGGDGNTVRVAVKLMQHRAKPGQRILTDSYQTILKLLKTPYTQPLNITPYNPYPELEVLDDKVWQEMNSQERRDWIEANTDINLTDVVPATAPAARVTNAIPVGFPDKIRSGIHKTLAYHDKMGLKCLSRGGRMVSDAIVKNDNMGLRQMKRIYNFLKKNQQHKSSTFADGCDAVMYHAWGGNEMHDFLDNKLKDVDQWLN